MEELIWKAWYPRNLVEDLVKWRPRKWHPAADLMANAAASHQRNIVWEHPSIEPIAARPGPCWQIHTDGSFHSGTGHGGSAFTIIKYDVEGRHIVYAKGLVLNNASAFKAEALAIKEALKYVLSLT